MASRRRKLHIPRGGFLRNPPLAHFAAPPIPPGTALLGSRWVPFCSAPWRVFGDFLHEQKVTRRRHVPLVETGRPVRRGDVGIAPYGCGVSAPLPLLDGAPLEIAPYGRGVSGESRKKSATAGGHAYYQRSGAKVPDLLLYRRRRICAFLPA